MHLFNILKNTTTDLSNSYNYAQSFLQNQNSNSTDWGFFIIILIAIITCIYYALYVPIKLYQINKNTKKINEELEKMNKNLYNIYKKDNQN